MDFKAFGKSRQPGFAAPTIDFQNLHFRLETFLRNGALSSLKTPIFDGSNNTS
jgi:hypothetical protein